jgi:hypothetical protein
VPFQTTTRPGWEPKDPSAVLWRYMPYATYVQLLITQELHFTRLDHLPDPWEGMPHPTYGWTLRRGEPPPREPPIWQTHFAVNCWCMRPDESISLWDRYCGAHGVAIKTTVDRMRRALGIAVRNVNVLRVVYSATSWRPDREPRHWLGMVRRKLPAYADEREVRAVISSMDLRREARLDPGGLDQEVDLGTLIEEVLVGPPWAPWFHKHVADFTGRCRVPADRVKRSTILDAPPSPL